MRKGLALQFKQKFPQMYISYKKVCVEHRLIPGKLHIYRTQIDHPQYIINFPTKYHWKEPSIVDYIVLGLRKLKQVIEIKSITSISIPPLGCGQGGLEWDLVKEVIFQELVFIGCSIFAYEPL